MSNVNEPLKGVVTSTPSAQVASAPAPAVGVSAEQVMELLKTVARLEAKVEPKSTKTLVDATEIDWSKVTEAQVGDLNFPIPVYEHEIPEYLNVSLVSNEYVSKWVHTSTRRLGSKLAEGYTYVTKEDWDLSKPSILPFNSEGHMVYEDVVALKIHKSRYFGMLRREVLKSTQIRGVAGYNKVKGMVNQSIQNTPGMESAINRGAMAFYGENADSRVEVNI
jgi:hypothetical protein